MSKEPKTTVSRESDKFMLRLPGGMRDRIAESAKLHGRSMNAEIVQVLLEHYGVHSLLSKDTIEVLDAFSSGMSFNSTAVNDLITTISEGIQKKLGLASVLDAGSNGDQRYDLDAVTLPPAPPDKPTLSLPQRNSKSKPKK